MAMTTDRIWNGASGDRDRTASQQSLWTRIDVALGNLMTPIFVWHDRVRQRRALIGLSDHALQDFGASRADATREADKPFWRP